MLCWERNPWLANDSGCVWSLSVEWKNELCVLNKTFTVLSWTEQNALKSSFSVNYGMTLITLGSRWKPIWWSLLFLMGRQVTFKFLRSISGYTSQVFQHFCWRAFLQNTCFSMMYVSIFATDRLPLRENFNKSSSEDKIRVHWIWGQISQVKVLHLAVNTGNCNKNARFS